MQLLYVRVESICTHARKITSFRQSGNIRVGLAEIHFRSNIFSSRYLDP